MKREKRIKLLLDQKEFFEEIRRSEERFRKMKRLIQRGVPKRAAVEAVSSDLVEANRFYYALEKNRELFPALTRQAYREVLRQLKELK